MSTRDFLKTIPFFANVLDRAQLDALAAAAVPRDVDPETVIIRERDLDDAMFVIVDGKVAVTIAEAGSERRVATLSRGDIFGEMSLMTGVPRLATVTAEDRVALLEITKPAIQPILAASPELYDRFAAVLKQRQSELDAIYDPGFWRHHSGLRDNLATVMRSYFAGVP